MIDLGGLDMSIVDPLIDAVVRMSDMVTVDGSTK